MRAKQLGLAARSGGFAAKNDRLASDVTRGICLLLLELRVNLAVCFSRLKLLERINSSSDTVPEFAPFNSHFERPVFLFAPSLQFVISATRHVQGAKHQIGDSDLIE